jgi:hypothetical protein
MLLWRSSTHLLVDSCFFKMTVVVSSVFWVLHFPHQEKIVTIDQLVFFTLDFRSNASYNIPFFTDSHGSYMSFGAGMFKDSSLIEYFPFPPPSSTLVNYLFNMIYLFTNGSLRSSDPWVVPHPEENENYGDSMPLTMVDIFYQVIQSTSTDTSHKLHPHMEYN